MSAAVALLLMLASDDVNWGGWRAASSGPSEIELYKIFGRGKDIAEVWDETAYINPQPKKLLSKMVLYRIDCAQLRIGFVQAVSYHENGAAFDSTDELDDVDMKRVIPNTRGEDLVRRVCSGDPNNAETVRSAKEAALVYRQINPYLKDVYEKLAISLFVDSGKCDSFASNLTPAVAQKVCAIIREAS